MISEQKAQARVDGGTAFALGWRCIAPAYGREDLKACWRLGWKHAQAASGQKLEKTAFKVLIGIKAYDGKHNHLQGSYSWGLFFPERPIGDPVYARDDRLALRPLHSVRVHQEAAL